MMRTVRTVCQPYDISFRHERDRVLGTGGGPIRCFGLSSSGMRDPDVKLGAICPLTRTLLFTDGSSSFYNKPQGLHRFFYVMHTD